MIVEAIFGGALGLANFLGGQKMAKEAQKKIDNFRWKELQNVGDSLSVSTLGADLQREEASRAMASSLDALRSGSVRGVVGGVGRIDAANKLMNKQIASDLDTQQKEIDYFKAQDEAKIRQMMEQRQADELAGYGNMLDVGRNQKQQGFSQMFNATASAASSGFGDLKFGSGTGTSTESNIFGNMGGELESNPFAKYL